jgi:nitrate reductase cytochrome c-type subunit
MKKLIAVLMVMLMAPAVFAQEPATSTPSASEAKTSSDTAKEPTKKKHHHRKHHAKKSSSETPAKTETPAPGK